MTLRLGNGREDEVTDSRRRPFTPPKQIRLAMTPHEALTLAEVLDRVIALEATGDEAATLKRVQAKLGASLIHKKEARVQR